MKSMFYLSAACLLAGTAATAQMPMAPAAPAMETAMPSPLQAMAFVAKAGAGDLYEIESSRLAAQKAGSTKVKAFARMMIEHHTMTTRDVMAAARAAGLTPPPPMLTAEQTGMIAQLQALSGPDFDRTYIAQQKQAHADALMLHQTFAADGDTPQLKAAARKAVPIVQRHITQLRGM